MSCSCCCRLFCVGVVDAVVDAGVGVAAANVNVVFAVECVQVLGIEAARESLLKELKDVISSDSGSAYVNYRHLALLVDCMTGLCTLYSALELSSMRHLFLLVSQFPVLCLFD
jgi:hypothetical protein